MRPIASCVPHHGPNALPVPEGAEKIALAGRQLQIVRLIARGLTNKEIAVSLGISTATVKTHLRFAFAAAGVHTRAALVHRCA